MAFLDRNSNNKQRLRRNAQRFRSGFAADVLDAIVNGVAFNDVPSGTINGVNAVFTFTSAPNPDTLFVWVSGVLMKDGDDYTVSGTTLTFTSIPTTGDWIRTAYIPA